MGNVKNELKGFESIPRDLVFDKSLSDRARFVYVFMACKPDGWNFFLEPMAKDIGYSVDTLRKYLNELVASGWLVKGEQTNEKGLFGAVEYTIKATKFTDTENFRHGKNTVQENIDNINIKDTDNKEKNKEQSLSKKEKSALPFAATLPCSKGQPSRVRAVNNHNDNNKSLFNKTNNKEKEYKEKFANFVALYKKMGGKARGLDTEFNDFTKRHKDWRAVLPYLELAVQREMKARNQAKAERKFFPEPKMLQTYLGKQRAWELYVTVGEDLTREEYTPECGGMLNWNDYYNAYLFVGMFYDQIADGYTDDNRPDGARIMLNNGRGFIVWNKETKKWETK